MLTYFIVLLFTVFFCLLANQSRTGITNNGNVFHRKTFSTKVFLILTVVILSLTAGLRYHVGTDYSNYIMLYETQYSSMSWNDFLNFDEPIVPFLGKISYMYFDSYYPMFLITSIITVSLALYGTYKETDDFLFVTLIYVFAGCWHGSFNGIRQYLAVSIVYLGRKYILERKFLKFILVCAIAFLAHKSALCFVLVYFVYSKKFTFVKMSIIIAATVLLSMNYETIFEFVGWISEKEFVHTDYSERSVNIFRILVGCVPALLGIYYAVTKKLDKEQIFNVYMLIANATVRIATSNSAYLARLGAYTGILVPLGLSSILQACDKKYYKILKFVTVVMYMLYWLYEINISSTLREFEWVFSYI